MQTSVMEDDTITQTDIPGTVYLVDVLHTHENIAHARNRDVLLIPQPLKTCRDPLNWSRRKKLWSLFLGAFFACAMSFGENNLGAAWTQIADETDVSLSNMNGGSALNYLFLGFINIMWIPTGMKLGRKFVYIASMLINMGAAIWNAYFYGTAQWYINNAFGGIGTSAYEAIIQLTVFDMFFTHERGVMLAFYIWGMQLGSILGLILGGYIAEGPGWRWGCKIVAILSGFVVFLFLFTFDDPMFPRHIWKNKPGLRHAPAEEQRTPDTNSTDEKSPSNKETGEQLVQQMSEGEAFADLLPRTYWQILCPIHYYPEDHTTWWQYFRRPFVLFLFPNIVVSGIIFAFGCTAGIVSFNTISEIMSDPPYNWATGSTGLLFLAALVGSFVGFGTGYIGDQIVLFLARRNDGYKEPEMRLWTLCFSFVYAAAGYFMYGWGANAGAAWEYIAVGLGCMIAHQVSATSVATAYAMECFEGISGELVVVLAICSSLINFAISFSVQPFINATNYGSAFSFYGALVLGSMLLAVPTCMWGKEWRRRCAGTYQRFIAEAVVV